MEWTVTQSIHGRTTNNPSFVGNLPTPRFYPVLFGRSTPTAEASGEVGPINSKIGLLGRGSNEWR